MNFSGHSVIVVLFIIAFSIALSSCSGHKKYTEMQITNDLSKNHDLDNNDNFSPDDQWLVYDTRTPEGGIGGCRTIEKVNVHTGDIVQVYATKNATPYGPGVGAASYSHVENRIIFIHGLQNCNAERPYAQWRRTGVIIDENNPGKPIFMDARDVTPPFTPGALRGGTHRHEWSGDGKWVGFTYNDAIMKALEDKTGQRWNLRTIGVSHALKPVQVDHDAQGENIDGAWFSVLVVKVVPHPRPGSDEISHAADDSWVGLQGYRRPDGTFQRARAFLGTVTAENGQPVKEVYIVDIPDRIDIPGSDGPLQGTLTTFPMPPKGTTQRRLTFTARTEYPGCSGIVRTSPDGDRIAFLAKDKNGIDQVFFISPLGSEPRQVTQHESSVQSGVRWSPDGNWICYIWDGSLVKCDVREGDMFGRYERLTPKNDEAPFNPVWSHDGKMIAYNKWVVDENGEKTMQIFAVKL